MPQAISAHVYYLATLGLLGGLALFLLGMELLTDGLKRAAGPSVRQQLVGFTRRRLSSFFFGTVFSAFVHSGPVVVLLVGFIHAGLISFPAALPAIVGASVGTAISMHAIAFDLGEMSLLLVVFGFLLRMRRGNEKVSLTGSSIIGLGLLFLGMDVMKSALLPLRESGMLAHWFGAMELATPEGMLFGFLAAALLTALLQSSGATIALAFTLLSTGALHNLREVLPLLLGAHVGTCVVGFFGAIGANVAARRAAMSHLVFNLFSSAAAIVLADAMIDASERTSTDLVRQAANLNLATQLVPALLVLPFTKAIAKSFDWFMPNRTVERDTGASHLDPELTKYAESALYAGIAELRRQALIVRRMLERSLDAVVSLNPAIFTLVDRDEDAVDAIKDQFDAYVVTIAERQLSRRQCMVLQRLINASNDIERIGDHVKTIGLLTRIKLRRGIWFPEEDMQLLMHLGRHVQTMLTLTAESLDPEHADYRSIARRVLEEREQYKRLASSARDRIGDRMTGGTGEAVSIQYYMRYMTVFDRISKHLKSIAEAELKPRFFFRPEKKRDYAPIALPSQHGPPSGFRAMPTFKEYMEMHPTPPEHHASKDEDTPVPVLNLSQEELQKIDEDDE